MGMKRKRWYGPTAPFPIDPNLFQHPKYVALTDRAKVHLIELWVGCWSGGGHGMVSKRDLNRKGAKVAFALLDGWVERTADPEIFYMHDYLEYHHPKSDHDVIRVITEREYKAGGGKLGMHNRWHVAKGVVKPGCDHCVGPGP